MNDKNKYYKELFLEKFRYIRDNGELFMAGIEYSPKIIKSLEQVLFDDGPLSKDPGYKYLESIKNDKKFLTFTKEHCSFASRAQQILDNLNIKSDITFRAFSVFKRIYSNIQDDSNGTVKEAKLDVLNEYARIARFANDGKNWTSGVPLNNHDLNNNVGDFDWIPRSIKYKHVPSNVKYNDFIAFFSKNPEIKLLEKVTDTEIGNNFHFTKKEIENLYLETHDEPIFDINIKCLSCHHKYRVVKENIYVDDKGDYYAPCNKCENFNKIPADQIDQKTKGEIELRRPRRSLKKIKDEYDISYEDDMDF